MTTRPTIDELSRLDLHHLNTVWKHEAALTVHYVLRGDHETARAHACEAKRHERAFNERLWRDGEAHTNGAEK